MMNIARNLLSLLAAASLLGGLTACNHKDDVTPLPDNVVRLTASIGDNSASATSLRVNPLLTDEVFELGDEIYVEATGTINGSETSVYRLGQDGKWAPAPGSPHLLWSEGTLSFIAHYPAALAVQAEQDGRLAAFQTLVPQDQSDEDKLAAADLMISTASGPITKTPLVDLRMTHQTVKVTVKITGFNNQYAAGVKVQSAKYVIGTTPDYRPFASGDGGVDTYYTIFLPDPMYGSGDLSFHVTMTDGSTAVAKLPFYTATPATLGNHYQVNLKVGKNRLELGEVTVSDWGAPVDLTGGGTSMASIVYDGTAHLTGRKVLNLEYASSFEEAKEALLSAMEKIDQEAQTAGTTPQHHFYVKGPVEKFLKDGHTLFHGTPVQLLDLSGVTGMTSIADKQFCANRGGDDLPELEQFYAPLDLISIGKQAFQSHPKLQRLYLSKVAEIKTDAFDRCGELLEVTSDGEINILGRGAFANCGKLEKAYLHAVEIGEEAFQGCNLLKEVTLPKAKILGRRCFDSCPALRKVVFSTVIERMAGSAFTEGQAREINLSISRDQKALKPVGQYSNFYNGLSDEDVEIGDNKQFGYYSETWPLYWKNLSYSID